MRRSICVVEPGFCVVGSRTTLHFIYTPATAIPKGARLRFDIVSGGRVTEWELPQTKEKKNAIWAQLPNGKPLAAKVIADSSLFEFVLPSDIKAGENFSIYLGSPLKGQDAGSRAQTTVQRRRPFHLYIDPKGKTDFREQESFHLDVRGGPLHHIRVVAPSIIGKNKRFDVIVRFEDEYGNLTSHAPEGTLMELSYENLRENLTWKLFVPETGFINLPNLYFNEAGVYKIQLRNLKTGDKYFSPPIKCLNETSVNLYWGLFHGESEKNDSAENIESCLRQFRDEKAYQFYATSSFESADETSNEVWKGITTQVAEFNEDHRFNTFLGFQYFSDGEGLRQIIYFKDGKPILRKKDEKTNSVKKLYKAVSPKEMLAISCFTMAKGFSTDFSEFNPDYDKLVEIYNSWGSSECTAKEGNLRPIKSTAKSGVSEVESGSVLKALRNNCRFGIVAGGLDDRGIYADFYDSPQVQYSPGLTAILSAEQSREGYIEALLARHCYATTGERMILGLTIAGAIMGDELSTKAKPGLVINRHIVGYAAGTKPLKEVILLRNGVPLKVFYPKSDYFDFEFDDSEHLSKAVLPGGAKPPFVFYHLRVIQQDGHIAWSSPIWIDAIDLPTPSEKKSRKK